MSVKNNENIRLDLFNYLLKNVINKNKINEIINQLFHISEIDVKPSVNIISFICSRLIDKNISILDDYLKCCSSDLIKYFISCCIKYYPELGFIDSYNTMIDIKSIQNDSIYTDNFKYKIDVSIWKKNSEQYYDIEFKLSEILCDFIKTSTDQIFILLKNTKECQVEIHANGTYGKVCCGISETGEKVAIKFGKNSDLKRDIEFLRDCSSIIGIIDIIGISVIEQITAIVMPFFPMTIDIYLKQSNLSFLTKTKLFYELLRILKQSHNAGWIHSDIKAQNILIDLKDPMNPMPIIIDGGLSTCIKEKKQSAFEIVSIPYKNPKLVYETSKNKKNTIDNTMNDWWAAIITFLQMLNYGKIPIEFNHTDIESINFFFNRIRKNKISINNIIIKYFDVYKKQNFSFVRNMYNIIVKYLDVSKAFDDPYKIDDLIEDVRNEFESVINKDDDKPSECKVFQIFECFYLSSKDNLTCIGSNNMCSFTHLHI